MRTADDPAHAGVEDWMLATPAWPGSVDNYVDALLWLVGGLLTDPRHFYRSFTTTELGHLRATRPANLDLFDHEDASTVNPTATQGWAQSRFPWSGDGLAGRG